MFSAPWGIVNVFSWPVMHENYEVICIQQENLFNICDGMLMNFTKILIDVKEHFEQRVNDPPLHAHLPPIASKLMWLKGLKARVNVSVHYTYCSKSMYDKRSMT